MGLQTSVPNIPSVPKLDSRTELGAPTAGGLVGALAAEADFAAGIRTVPDPGRQTVPVPQAGSQTAAVPVIGSQCWADEFAAVGAGTGNQPALGPGSGIPAAAGTGTGVWTGTEVQVDS